MKHSSGRSTLTFTALFDDDDVRNGEGKLSIIKREFFKRNIESVDFWQKGENIIIVSWQRNLLGVKAILSISQNILHLIIVKSRKNKALLVLNCYFF